MLRLFEKNCYKYNPPEDDAMEDAIIRTAIRPFAIMDMGYGAICDVNEKKLTFELKHLYRKIMADWIKVYKALHRGFTEQELITLTDYEESITDSLKNQWEMLRLSIVGRLMDMPQEDREEVAKVLLCEIICTAACTFIAESMQLYNRRFKVKAAANGRVKFHERKRNDYNEICETLCLIVVNSERLADKMRAKSLHVRTSVAFCFDDDPCFKANVKSLFSTYLNVNVDGEQ